MSASNPRDLAWKTRPRWGYLLLSSALAIAVSGLLAKTQHEVNRRLDLAEVQHHVPQSIQTGKPKAHDPLDGLDNAGLEKVSNELMLLNRDWPALLASVVPQLPQTRLLSVEVNPANGSVLLTGQAPGHDEVSAYTVELDASGALQNVRLLDVESQNGSAVFEVSAQWR